MEITEELRSVIRQIIREELGSGTSKKGKPFYPAKEIAPIVSWWLYTRGFGVMARADHKYEILSKVTGYSVHTFRNYVGSEMRRPSTDRQIEIMCWLDDRMHALWLDDPEYIDALSKNAGRPISMKLVKENHEADYIMWSQSVADYFEHCYNQFLQRKREISI